MSTGARSSALSGLARLGFGDLAEADGLLDELGELTAARRDQLLTFADLAADPDDALAALVRIARRDADAVRDALVHSGPVLWRLLGASSGFAEFYLRHPRELDHLAGAGGGLPSTAELEAELRDAVGADDEGFAASGD